ncbi:Ribonuclease BN [Streptomyces cyaneofuscatus]
MSVRELVVLGTASQVPTRHRNHNGYLLRWDGEGILFDPGEGTQRQMLRAGVAAPRHRPDLRHPLPRRPLASASPG